MNGTTFHKRVWQERVARRRGEEAGRGGRGCARAISHGKLNGQLSSHKAKSLRRALGKHAIRYYEKRRGGVFQAAVSFLSRARASLVAYFRFRRNMSEAVVFALLFVTRRVSFFCSRRERVIAKIASSLAGDEKKIRGDASKKSMPYLCSTAVL